MRPPRFAVGLGAVALAIIIWRVKLLRALLLGLAAGALLAGVAHATPLPDPAPGAGPVVLLPPCHLPVKVRSYVEVSVNGVIVCASQVDPPKHRRHHR